MRIRGSRNIHLFLAEKNRSDVFFTLIQLAEIKIKGINRCSSFALAYLHILPLKELKIDHRNSAIKWNKMESINILPKTRFANMFHRIYCILKTIEF